MKIQPFAEEKEEQLREFNVEVLDNVRSNHIFQPLSFCLMLH